jgi:hypothetical protein
VKAGFIEAADTMAHMEVKNLKPHHRKEMLEPLPDKAA